MPPLLPLPLVELPANCSRLEIVVEDDDDAVTDFVVLPWVATAAVVLMVESVVAALLVVVVDVVICLMEVEVMWVVVCRLVAFFWLLSKVVLGVTVVVAAFVLELVCCVFDFVVAFNTISTVAKQNRKYKEYKGI